MFDFGLSHYSQLHLFTNLNDLTYKNSNMLCASKSVDYSEACFFFSFFFFFHGTKNALTFEGPEAPLQTSADRWKMLSTHNLTSSDCKDLVSMHETVSFIPLVLKTWWLAIETQNLRLFMQLIVFLVCVGDLESLFWGTQ